MAKLFIGTPAYGGSVTCAYASSLTRTFFTCAVAGIEVVNAFKQGCCYVDLARNYLVHLFLKSDADTLLFIDADMGWDDKVVPRMFHSPSGIVGGAYPMKQEREQYPVQHLGMQQGGFVEVQYLPTGFLMVKRDVFLHLMSHVPQYRDGESGEMISGFFRCVMREEGYTGEDVEFCNQWRLLGGKIWCLPNIDFEHQGTKIWSGNYGDHLGPAPTLPTYDVTEMAA